jgi:hypothetical protein
MNYATARNTDEPRCTRRLLAGPVYFMAFVLHLLCTGVTVLAAKIAKDPC